MILCDSRLQVPVNFDVQHWLGHVRGVFHSFLILLRTRSFARNRVCGVGIPMCEPLLLERLWEFVVGM